MLTNAEIDELLKDTAFENTDDYTTSTSSIELHEDFFGLQKESKVELFKLFKCEFCLEPFLSKPTLWQEFINEQCCPHCSIPSTIVKKKIKNEKS